MRESASDLDHCVLVLQTRPCQMYSWRCEGYNPWMSKVGRNNHERINSVRAALVVSLHWCGHMGGIEPTVCRDATNRVLFRIVRTENTHDCAKTSFLTLHPRRQSAGLSARARLNERRPELVQPKLAEGQESRWLLQATGVESDQSAAVRPRQVPPT
jgi:hypothetical protein